MAKAHDFTIRSRRVVLPPPEGERAASVRIVAGRIAAIGPYVSGGTTGGTSAGTSGGTSGGDVEGEDLGDMVVLPGLIDPHVHCNEPGHTDWEGFASATRAAAAGGITLIADMPLNSLPVTTTVAALQAKQAAATGQLTVDVAFHGGLVPGNLDHVALLVDAGVVGIKAFLCHSGLDAFPNASPSDLRAAMRILAESGVPLLAHAELVQDVPPMDDPRSYRDYVATRPRSFERDAVALLIDLCRDSGAKVHVVHLAEAECLAMLRLAKADGLAITVETCPHYLSFHPATIPDGSVAHKCAPPIRGDGPALFRGLLKGDIDLIASDHSPCPPSMKDALGRLDRSWGGISSLQLGLAAVRTAGASHGVTPTHIAQWMSSAPARLLGVDRARGSITPGKRADLCVVDWDATWTVDPAKLHHRHPITPYAGMTLTGQVHRTYVAGECVYDRGRFAATPLGRMISRHG